MAGDSIGKLSLKIDGDVSGLNRAIEKVKADINGLTSQGAKTTAHGMASGEGLDIKSLMSGEGLLSLAGKFAGVAAAIGGVVVVGKQLFHTLDEAGSEVKNLQLAAERAGVSFDWMQRAGHYAEQVGVELEAVMSGLGKF